MYIFCYVIEERETLINLKQKKADNESQNESRAKRSSRLSKKERIDYKTTNVRKRLIQADLNYSRT